MALKNIPLRRISTGFTLIELMIVVAVIAILASIAIPNYSQYITRGRLTDGQKILAAYSLAQEQYFQNNNRYSSTAGGNTCGVSVSGSSYSSADFALTCNAASDTTFTATLTGSTGGRVAGYTYTVNDAGTRKTTQFKGATKDLNCWIVSDSSSC